MKRAILLIGAAAAAFAYCAQAFAGTGQAAVSATLSQSAGINIIQPLVLPNVTTTAIAVSPVPAVVTSSAGSNVTSSAGRTVSSGAAPISNAALTIHGQSGDTVSMAVPQSFQVIRDGGAEALTVKTSTNSEYGLASNGVVLGGTVMNSDTMSVNIGGALTIASAGNLVPGPYEGLLVVVVQYN